MNTFADVKPRTPSTLYHYTSQAGLLGIIKEKKLKLSSIRHLNDSAEITHAVEIMRQRLPLYRRPEGISDEIWSEFSRQVLEFMPGLEVADHFVGSFSANKDQLSQWRAYSADGVGFSIGFDRQRLISLATRQEFLLRACTYDPKEQRARIDGIIESSLRELKNQGLQRAVMLCVVSLLLMAPRLKHPSFSEEEEWRLISNTKHVIEEPDDFRLGRSMLVPYRIFDLKEEDENTPIIEVVVGPAPHMHLSVASVSALLKKSGIEAATVNLSEVPYRNW